MKIFDCFSYWDEDLLLDLRLNILNDCVDYFVIVEGNKTWQNNSKMFRFDINKFEKFKKKIIYVKVEDLPDGKNPYLRENHQRNSITKGLKDADKDDLIITIVKPAIPRFFWAPANIKSKSLTSIGLVHNVEDISQTNGVSTVIE